MREKKRINYLFVILTMSIWLCTACQPNDAPFSSETEETTVPETEPVITAYDYYIEELDVTLTIPEDLHVYRIDGVYQDWTDEINVHNFSQWIVMTDKEYDESTLAYELRDNHAEQAKHVIWGINLVPKELYPVNRMCQGLFGISTYTVTDSGYCEVLNTEITGLAGGWLDNGNAKIVDSETEKQREKWSAWIDKWEMTISEHTLKPVNVWSYGDTLYANDLLEADTYQFTIVNHDLWENYVKAVDELTAYPEKYQYEEAVAAPFVERMRTQAANSCGDSNWVYASETLSSVYADASQDIYLRAYGYATRMVREGKTGEAAIDEELLSRIMVVRLDWENGQKSYGSYIVDADTYVDFFGGYDHSVDLTEAYRYVQEYSARTR